MSSSHRGLIRKNTAMTMERTAGTWKPIIAVHNLHGQGCALHNLRALNSQSFAATITVTGSDPKIVHIGTDDRGRASFDAPHHPRHAHPLPKALPMRINAKDRYTITGADVDLAAEVIVDSDGRRIDRAYVDEVVAAAHEVLDKRTGRPSLTGKAEHSPQVTFRITPELKARAEHAAAVQGTTVSRLAREAFERYLAS